MALTRNQIIRAAADLLAEHGLAGMSVREVARRVGVSAPTLLWHVGSKRELLDMLAEHVLRDGAPGEHPAADQPAADQHWADWLVGRARTMFAAMTRYRDAPLLVAGNRPTPQSLPAIERTLRVLGEHGVEPGEALQILFVLTSYVGGSALEWQAEADRARSGADPVAEGATDLFADHPSMRRGIEHLGGQPRDATFELGLGLLVDGLRARYP